MRQISDLSPDERNQIIDRSTETDRVVPDVGDILKEVRERGDAAVEEFTSKFDDVDLDSPTVDESRIEAAFDEVNDGVLEAVDEAAERIEEFHSKQVREDYTEETDEGIEVGRRFVPLDSVGAYVPGGGAAYPSTALMTVIPAKVAGVERVIACTPPRPEPLTVVALSLAGADEVYEIGGAQAVGAMAYGTDSVEGVDKIVGPGNIYVTAAKELVQGDVLIDFPAGPSEIGVVADGTAEPEFVAADMLAQAEHDPNASVLAVATSRSIADEIEDEIETQMGEMERGETASQVVDDSSVLYGDLDDCVDLMREYAPEHLSIFTEDDEEVLDRVRHAGSVFLGNYTPVAAGDYATGTNHVLPTSGNARLYGGLSVDDFVKGVTVQRLSKEGLGSLADTITTLAREEGLPAHAKSVDLRTREDD
ncbi:MAG: histidinol dehydrogenase [Halobacteria archaeon]|nr:histidinol dehydrogenase [Halobacteria archaeon]